MQPPADGNLSGRGRLRRMLLTAGIAGSLSFALLPGAAGVHAAEFMAPVISIEGIHSPTVSFEGANLICTVRVDNPNAEALTVTGGIVDLQLDGSQAARGRPVRKVSIPPLATRNVDLRVSLTSNAALAWLPMFMGPDAFTLPYRVIGYVNIGGGTVSRVPFDETGTVSMTSDGLIAVPTRQARASVGERQ